MRDLNAFWAAHGWEPYGSSMRAHLVQFDIAWEDKDANFRRVRDLLHHASVTPGDLVVLPEMFDTGFSFHTDATADRDSRTLNFLLSLARDLGATIQGGRTVHDSEKAENRAPVVNPTGLVIEYAKIHPFTFGRESEHFQGGERVLTYDWTHARDSLRVCPAICYDLRFPELFRKGLALGAEVFTYGANWPEQRHHHWRSLSIARAIENQAFVLAVNRCGRDPHLSYAGGTIAIDPQGRVIGELDDHERVLTVEIDPEAVRSWRRTFPAWRDAGRV